MFSFDMTAVSASIEVFPTGKYPVVILSEPKAYKQAGTPKKDNPEESWPDKQGVRYTLRIADGEHKGKPILYSIDFNFDGGVTGKRFLMAALGYKADSESEARFNVDMKAKYGDDLIEATRVDADTNYVGEVWKSVKGNNTIADLDINMVGDKLYQKFKAFLPVE